MMLNWIRKLPSSGRCRYEQRSAIWLRA
jgi:hypothetical protein